MTLEESKLALLDYISTSLFVIASVQVNKVQDGDLRKDLINNLDSALEHLEKLREN